MKLYSDTRSLGWYNAPTGHFKKLNEWGVYFDDILNAGADSGGIKSDWSPELIHKFVQNIINVELNGASFKRPTKSDGKGWYEYIKPGEETNTLSVSDLIQGRTQNIINPPRPANINTRLDDD